VATACGKIPVPVSETGCADPGTAFESSVIVSVAASAAAVDGVNVTLTRHEAAGASAVLFAHVVPAAVAKSAAFVPLYTMAFAAARFRVSVPVFFTVTVRAALVVPLR
jgi:hypothetical protein